MIEINNISKVFRTSEVETVALNHVNLDVKEGEFVAIMGPSGCGKSTLLNILGLLDNPTEGSYKLLGQEVADLKEKERTRVRKGKLGFVFQSFNLIDELNVYENVELPLTYLGVKAGERKRMVEDILKRMNISHRAKHFPQQLSGGQQQRVAIARALVKMPRVLLLDEPLSNLDARLRLQTREEIRRIQRETKITTIFVTHDQEEALSISDLIVEEGYINLDFADVSTIMKGAGYAHLAIGHGSGKDKAKEAANAVIASPLLETSIAGAKRLLINITMSEDILSSDVDNATKMITDKAADNVEFIFGTAFKEDMQDEMTITVIAAGFDEETDDSEEAEEPAAEEAAAPEEPEAQPQPQPQPQQTQAAANGGKKPADPDDLMAIFEILDRK